MRKIIILLAIIIAYPSVSFSQKKSDANVSGHVIDKGINEHVAYINVTIKGTTIGTTTDATGHYFLKNIPTGKHTILVSGIGYKSIEKQVYFSEGKTLEVNFETFEDAINLENVVVSATRNEINRKESPTLVSVINQKLFENTNAVCLAQGLNFQPGLRIENNCQNCGFQQVRINGLDGPYSQILIDSRPIFSSLAGVYGLEQIPVNMIERVEVIRGGGSAIFGSSAIAGTVNIITKEPLINSASISNTTSLIYGRSSDVNTSINASFIDDDYKTGLTIFGSIRDRSSLDYDGDGFSEVGIINLKNIGLRGFYKIDSYNKLTLEYHTMGEYRRGGDSLELPPHQANIAEQTEHNINTGSFKYDYLSKSGKNRFSLYSSFQNIDRKSYYGAQKNVNAYGKTNDITLVIGMQQTYFLDKLIFLPAVLTGGIEYNTNTLNDKMIGYGRELSQSVKIKSLFLQNEWKNKKVSILLGVRLDKHNLIDHLNISPRINIRYNPTEEISIRASYSSGFRAPQSFDEDLHITAIGGNVAIIQLSHDLKSEKSQSLSSSIDLYKNIGNVQTNFLIEGFYTTLDNVFLLEEKGKDLNGNIILERQNGSGATVKGINLEGKIVPHKNILLQFGSTLQSSKYKKDQIWSDNKKLSPQRRIFRSPDVYGYFTASCQPLKSTSISLSGTYTGKMLVQHFAGYIPEDTEKMTTDFYDLNAKFSYSFTFNRQTKVELHTGIQNILNSYQKDFDKGENRDAGYIYGPALPRTVTFGIKIQL